MMPACPFVGNSHPKMRAGSLPSTTPRFQVVRVLGFVIETSVLGSKIHLGS